MWQSTCLYWNCGQKSFLSSSESSKDKLENLMSQLKSDAEISALKNISLDG